MKKNELSLKDFPPKLRRLARFMLENEEKKTVSHACRELGFNKRSIFTMIHRSKRKGHDFNELLADVSDFYLKTELINVDKKTIEWALTGSARDRELFYKRIGVLKNSPKIEINNNLGLTFAVKVDNVSDSNKRPKGQNELRPYIPNKS